MSRKATAGVSSPPRKRTRYTAKITPSTQRDVAILAAVRKLRRLLRAAFFRISERELYMEYASAVNSFGQLTGFAVAAARQRGRAGRAGAVEAGLQIAAAPRSRQWCRFAT